MSAVIKVPDLINLALWSPDPSQISLDVLKTVLLIVAQQLNLDDQKVVFKGEEGEKIKELIKKAPPNVATQIKVTTEEEEKAKHQVEGDMSESRSFETGKKRHLDSDEELLTYENGHLAKRTKFIAVTPSSFTRLEGKVKALQAHLELLGTSVIPSSEAIIESARTSEGKPITDLWQSMNITKRMTGAEEGIDKLASLLEIVVREYADLKSIIDRLQDELGEGLPETLNQIKLAADYAKKIRPREELYGGKMPKREKRTAAGPTNTGEKGNEQTEANIDEGGQTSTKTETRTSNDPPGTRTSNDPPGTRTSKDPTETTTDEGGASEAEPDNQLRDETTNKGDEAGTSNRQSGGQQASKSGRKTFDRKKVGSITDVIEPFDEGGVTVERLNQFLGQHEYMRRNMEYLTAQINTLADFADEVLPEVLAGMPHMEELRKRIKELRGSDSAQSLIGQDAKYLRRKLPVKERIEDIEIRIADLGTRIKRQDALLCHKTDLVSKELQITQSTIKLLNTKMKGVADYKKRVDSMVKVLYENTKDIDIAEQTLKVEFGLIRVLLKDRKAHLEAVQEIVETILQMKISKPDRYEIDELLAKKADLDAVKKNVSHDDFDKIFNLLDQRVVQLKELVEDQVTQLNDIIDEVYKEMDGKYDKYDVTGLVDVIETEIKKLKKRIEEVAAMKEEKISAGVKSQLLREVNCLACDQKVAIPVENDGPCIPTMGEVPPYKNLRPFITYELDNLRKMKTKHTDDPNVIDYEKFVHNDEAAKLFRSHITNRYCGGSHTELTPLQKVIHLEQVKTKPPESPKTDKKPQNTK